MKTARHSWGGPIRNVPDRTHRFCAKCGMEKRTRHEGGEHWVEFYTDSGMRIPNPDGRTPPCNAEKPDAYAQAT